LIYQIKCGGIKNAYEDVTAPPWVFITSLAEPMGFIIPPYKTYLVLVITSPPPSFPKPPFTPILYTRHPSPLHPNTQLRGFVVGDFLVVLAFLRGRGMLGYCDKVVE
jgi:hypothetical protein